MSKSKSSPKLQLIEFPSNYNWRLILPGGEITLTTTNEKLSYERAMFLLSRGQYVLHRDAEELLDENFE